jgi:tetratricopeptide (TPR) repeat protein
MDPGSGNGKCAARALAAAQEHDDLLEPDRSLFDHTLAEYISVQSYNADRPEGRTNLGNLYGQRGDSAAAIAEYRKATEIDPTYIPAYANLADLYRARGAEAEARKILQDGLARNPRAAVLEHALGLALARQKRTSDSVQLLRAAALHEPDNAHLAYVFAVAMNDSGQPKEGLKVLDRALKRHPYDREILSGLVYFRAKEGSRDKALGFAKQLRELDPENAEYRRMVDMLEESPHR